MEKEHFTIQTDQYILANGLRIENMALELILILMAILMKATGNLIQNTVKAPIHLCKY